MTKKRLANTAYGNISPAKASIQYSSGRTYAAMNPAASKNSTPILTRRRIPDQKLNLLLLLVVVEVTL